jgi:protease-4
MSSERRRSRTGTFLVGCGVLFVLAAAFILILTLLPLFTGSDVDISAIGHEKVAVVEVFGPIMVADKAVEQIRKYAGDDAIKGILVHIDSPGGTVGAAQEIYSALLEAKKKKPVVASMGTLGASGGYYIAMAADKVIANPGTITGSIGVIMAFMDARSLMSKIGLKTITVTSAKFKEIGTGSREFTEEDRAVLQTVIDDVHRQFVEAVAESRHLDIEKVKKLADGRVFSGRQALAEGLVDELGSYRRAVDILAGMAGIKGEPAIVREKERFSFLKDVLSEKLGLMKTVREVLPLRAGLHYLWTISPN